LWLAWVPSRELLGVGWVGEQGGGAAQLARGPAGWAAAGAAGEPTLWGLWHRPKPRLHP